MADQFVKEAFEPHIRSRFTFSLPGDSAGARATLELIDVSERHKHPRVRQFSLLFRAQLDTQLPRQVLRMEHAALGPMDVYVERVIPLEPGHAYYEAVFSRMLQPEAPSA